MKLMIILIIQILNLLLVILFFISKLYLFYYFYSEKKAVIIEQGDEVIRIKFEEKNEYDNKKWICTNDSKIQFLKSSKEDLSNLNQKKIKEKG